MQSLILSKAQAEAIYQAMCALNNVGGRLDCTLPSTDGGIKVCELAKGSIRIFGANPEIHADQSAFAAAYGLQQGDGVHTKDPIQAWGDWYTSGGSRKP